MRSARLRRGIAAVTGISIVALAGIAMSQPASAASPTATVVVTTQRMADASLTSTQSGTYKKGAVLSLSCYKQGQAVKGYYSGSFPNGYDSLWYKVSDGFYVADVDINTKSNSPVTGKCPTSNASVDTNAWYTFTVRGSGLLLDIRGGGSSNGTAVQQYPANGTASQKVRLTSNGDGTYRIYSALSSTQVFDVDGRSKTKVQSWAWGAGANQKWLVRTSKKTGYVTLSPLSNTSKCLDVPGGSIAKSVQLQVYTCNNTAAQDFAMKNVGVVNPVAGACNGFKGAKTLGTYTIAGYRLPVCGPRPDWDVPSRTESVRPYKGAPTSNPGYQCAELPARWLWYRYKVASVKANGAQVVDAYASRYAAKFTKVANGTAHRAPVAGDVLSLSGNARFSDFGHTGVVVSSTVSSAGNGSITVAEQNWGGAGGSVGKHIYQVKAWKVVYAGLPYVKWLHAK